MGSLAFTSSKYTQQKGFFPTMPGVTHVPYPNPYRPLFAGADQGQAVLDYIEDVLFPGSVPPSEVAAVLVEPIQGEGGYLVPPDGFLQGLRDLCDRHGILLIFDEVQSGVGRTGKMFASQHWGVAPDIMTLAKGLGSGLPIGAVVAKKRLMEKWPRGAHGNTFGGNPLCCAAALATLDLVEREYAANAATVGEHFMARLRELQARHEVIGDVRGKGLMIGMELVKDRASRAPAKELCDAVIHRAFHNGLHPALLRDEHRALHAAAPGHDGRRGRGGHAPGGEPRGCRGAPPPAAEPLVADQRKTTVRLPLTRTRSSRT